MKVAAKAKAKAKAKANATVQKTAMKAKATATQTAAKFAKSLVMKAHNITAQKRPAAKNPMVNENEPESAEDRLAKIHGLDGIDITAYDRIKFKATMRQALEKKGQNKIHDIPEEILDEWEQLSDKKDKTPGKEQALRLLRKAWKYDPTWGHPMIKEKVMRRQEKTIRDVKKAMIWPRMCQKLGGEAAALKALKNNDIYSITDMHNVGKKLYIMREYVDERKWTSMREKSGEQALATAVDGITNHATCEALLGNLFDMHDDMPELMDFVDEAHE